MVRIPQGFLEEFVVRSSITNEEHNWCIYGELMDPERLDYL